jgi:hypothetical protein
MNQIKASVESFSNSVDKRKNRISSTEEKVDVLLANGSCL